MVTSHCKWCGELVKRRGKPAVFCSLRCKGEWQQTQKPVDREWLVQKYVQDGLSTYQIGQLVGRNPKQVYTWLTGYGIPTRIRGWSIVPHALQPLPHQDADWLRHQYVDLERSAADIAVESGVTENNILYFLRKHQIPRRSMGEVRATKHWGLSGEANGMYGRRGPDVPSWKGGVTPERQTFYSTPEWETAALLVRQRDKNICQRCGMKPTRKRRPHIHHIVSFAVRRLRTEPTNLTTLCHSCHRFVHSRANVAGDFIRKEVPQ